MTNTRETNDAEGGRELRGEVRGYEIACWNGRDFEQVAHFRPTSLALAQCRADARWLQERHPKLSYSVRVLVSLEMPEGNPEVPNAE